VCGGQTQKVWNFRFWHKGRWVLQKKLKFGFGEPFWLNLLGEQKVEKKKYGNID